MVTAFNKILIILITCHRGLEGGFMISEVGRIALEAKELCLFCKSLLIIHYRM